MSTLFTRWAIRVSDLTDKEYRILTVLADIAKDDDANPETFGKSWLSQKQLMVRTNTKSDMTLRKAIKKLEERDLIVIDREPMGNGGRHQYYINADVLEEEFEIGKATLKKKDRLAREAEAQRASEYRAYKNALKAREDFIAWNKKQEEEKEERKRRLA